MSIFEQITTDLKEAMKAKDETKLSTLRMLKSAIKNKQIELQKELEDEDVQAVVKSQIKQLKDSLQSFVDAARDDLAEGVKKELAVLEAYMPEQMSDEDLGKVVKEAIEEVGATTKAEMGKVMGVAMKKVGGAADGTRVKEIVQKLLPAIVLGVFIAEPALAASDASTFLVPAIRILRIFLLLFGIIAINMILVGGFTYMVASGRDDVHAMAMQKIGTGVLSTILIAGLFTIATVALQNLG